MVSKRRGAGYRVNVGLLKGEAETSYLWVSASRWSPQVLVRRRCITGYRFCIGLRKNCAAARFLWLSTPTWLPQEGDDSGPRMGIVQLLAVVKN